MLPDKWLRGKTKAGMIKSMTAVPFDTLALARRLREEANFTSEQAEGVASALAGALGADLVTKDFLRSELRDLEQRMTTKLGGMIVIAVGILAALIKLP